MPMNFNEAEPQKTGFGSPIPHGTVAIVVASLRPGKAGPDGWLKENNDGSCVMADFEFTIDGGEFDRRKFWTMFVVDGETDGQKKAAAISRSRLRAMLESANGIEPSDESTKAIAARQVESWGDFDGLRFCARVGLEKGKPKNPDYPKGDMYPDKNVLQEAVTPDNKDYIALSGVAQSKPRAAAPASSVTKPKWAS